MNGNIHKLQAMDEETKAYQELSSNIKFKQNLVQGLGVATVFGMLGAAGNALFAATKVAFVSGGFAAAAPWALGLAAIMVMGVGCLYAASKYYAESTRLDQNYQAKQIANGVKAPAIAIEQKPVLFQTQQAVASTNENLDKAAANPPAAPSTQVQQVELKDKVVPITLANARTA